MEKRGHSNTVSGNANLCSHTVENSMGVSQKLNMELSYDPAIPRLCIEFEKAKTLIWKDTAPQYS